MAISTPTVSPATTPTDQLHFYGNTTGFAVPPANESACTVYSYSFAVYNYCYSQAVSPSIVTLGNGNVGIGYSMVSNETNCPSLASSVYERVGFSTSSNGGNSFSGLTFIGNQTCSYLDAIEPSFAVGPTGTVYGAFVEENYSGNQGNYATNGLYSYCYYCTYNNRSLDALAFTTSSDNGTTFTAPVTLNSSGWIAKPQVAVFGQTVYILYENVDNSTNSTIAVDYGYDTDYAPALELIVSKDGGVTWSKPLGLPGVNSATYYVTVGGWIAVNKTGTVGVSYFTNHTCVFTYYGYCEHEGNDLVYSYSTNNGTTFHGPFTVASAQGDADPYMTFSYNFQAYFQFAPSSSLAFSPDGMTAYIGWTSAYNVTALYHQTYSPYNFIYEYTGAFASKGTSTGTGWTFSILRASTELYSEENSWSLSLAANSGGVFVTYTTGNETYCYAGCPYTTNAYFQTIQNSTDGVTWSSPSYATFVKTYGLYSLSSSFPGLSSSVGFNSTGGPLYSYSLPQPYSSSFWCGSPCNYNYTYATDLFVAKTYSGPTLTINVTESGLTTGTAWTVSINGNNVQVPGTSSTVQITNVPVNGLLLVSAPSLQAGYAEIAFASISIPGQTSTEGAAEFSQNGTIYVNYSFEYGLTMAVEPNNPYDFQVYFYGYINGTYYNFDWFICGACTPFITDLNPAFPWYLPQGTALRLAPYDYPFSSFYWVGSGNGSFTGVGAQANVTFNGPLNETIWMGGFGTYNVSVGAPSLPSGSTFSFNWDGTPYSATTPNLALVPYAGTGSHSVTDVQATSATAGWEYFGQPAGGNPVLVPNQLLVNLTFAYVDVGASVGKITFQAQGLTAGTVWQFEFNGTRYSSASPWLNISAHPGTYPTSAFPVVAENASVGYAPVGVPSTWSVTTGSTYLVNYTSAYRVAVVAGTGGTVTGAGTTWQPTGSSLSYQAVAKTGYTFGGWSGSGTGSYSGSFAFANFTVGGPIVETAAFLPLPQNRFNITFQENNLAPGTWWTVYLNGVGYSANTPTFTVQNLLPCTAPGGNYNLSIPYAYSSNDLTRYVPTSALGKTVCTTGTKLVTENFAAQFYLTLEATPGGYATATVGPVTTPDSLWVAAGATVGLSAIALSGYNFLGWNGTGQGNYTGAGAEQTILLAGPTTELAVFAQPYNPPPATYTVDFHLAQTLATGTSWSLTLGTATYSSTTADLLVTGLSPQSYALSVQTALSPDSLTKYTPVGNPTSVPVTSNKTIAISFQTYYWLEISFSAGGTSATASQWVVSGGSVTLNASANLGYTFVGWAGTGPQAYSGPIAGSNVKVTGPTTEVASFAPIVKSTQTVTGSNSLFSAPTTWIGLGVVGLLVGLVVGLLAGRRRGGGSAPASMAPTEATSMDPSPPAEGGTSP